MTSLSDKTFALIQSGFYVGPRPAKMNTAFIGQYCICDIMGAHPNALAQEDAQGGDGFFAIVGDNLEDLINQAFDWGFDFMR